MKVYILVKYSEIGNETELLDVWVDESKAELKASELNKGTLTWPYYVIVREITQ